MNSQQKAYIEMDDSENSSLPHPDGYYFNWGCTSDLEGLNAFLKCGDTLEDTYGDFYFGANVSTYSRFCTCCGDHCNDDRMNDKCNETPVYTKTCYGAGRTEVSLEHFFIFFF